MRLIESLIKSLERKYPDRYISIEQSFDYHRHEKPRVMRIVWTVYVEEFVHEQFEKFEDMVNYINGLTGINMRIVIERRTDHGNVDPYAGSGEYKGD